MNHRVEQPRAIMALAACGSPNDAPFLVHYREPFLFIIFHIWPQNYAFFPVLQNISAKRLEVCRKSTIFVAILLT
jgi:hypothetical protein